MMLKVSNLLKTVEDKVAFAWALVSFIGFLDSTYLSLNRFLGKDLICSFWQGCTEVTTSSYSSILSIPVAYMGVIFYLAVFLGAIFYLDTKNKNVFKSLILLSVSGFLFTLWLLFVQTFFIEAYCVYCLVSAGTSTILIFISLIYFLKTKSF